MAVGQRRARMLVVGVLPVLALGAACSSHDGSKDVAGLTKLSSAASNSHESTRDPVIPIPSPIVPKPATGGTNRRLAMAAAARAMRHFPVPPGSRRISAAPAHDRHLQRLRVFDLPVDQSLTRTRWWLAPLRYDRLVDWYVAHTPADRRTTSYHADGPSLPEAEVYWYTHVRSKAFSPPSEVVAYSRIGPHLTAIRTDVTIAARADRDAKTLAPASVTSLQITKKAIDGPNTAPKTVTVTDKTQILPVIAAYNHALGEYVSTESFGCGSPAGIVYLYAVTFRWPGHTLEVEMGQPLCGVGRTLKLDGTRLPQTVTDSHLLTRALKTAFDEA